jgi:thymidylate synthase ThyX
MSYACKIIADSVSAEGVRLTTFEICFPRMVLAEFNTHRVFSRNSASSRAIPVKVQLAKVLEDPFIPIYWGKNQKGMQASEELDPTAQADAVKKWLFARDSAVATVKYLNEELDVHKQIANRLLEPFMWHTVVCTSTEWANYFHLRNNRMAQPEIHRIADMMDAVYTAGTPKELAPHEWHLPYVRPEEYAEIPLENLIKLSCARCARVSYLTQDGVRDVEADYTLYNRLLTSGHMSPFEHAARPMREVEIADYKLVKDVNSGSGELPFLGNFRGWVQHRKEIPGEHDMQAPKG